MRKFKLLIIILITSMYNIPVKCNYTDYKAPIENEINKYNQLVENLMKADDLVSTLSHLNDLGNYITNHLQKPFDWSQNPNPDSAITNSIKMAVQSKLNQKTNIWPPPQNCNSAKDNLYCQFKLENAEAYIEGIVNGLADIQFDYMNGYYGGASSYSGPPYWGIPLNDRLCTCLVGINEKDYLSEPGWCPKVCS